MTNAEDVCRSITAQLLSFTQQLERKYHLLLEPLREENVALRARLASMSHSEEQYRLESHGRQLNSCDENAEPVCSLLLAASNSPRIKSTTPRAPPKKKILRTPRGVSHPGDGTHGGGRPRLMFSTCVLMDGQQLHMDESGGDARRQLLADRQSTSTPSTLMIQRWSPEGVLIAPPRITLPEDDTSSIHEHVWRASLSKDTFSSSDAMHEVVGKPVRGATSDPVGDIASREFVGTDMQSTIARLTMNTPADFMQLTGPLLRWHQILVKCCTRSLFGMMPLHRAKLERCLQLRPAWEMSASDLSKSKSMGPRMLETQPTVATFSSSRTQVQKMSGEGSICRNRWSRFILHPDSKWIFPWALASAIVILWDIITFPLAGFDLDDTQFDIIIMWSTTIFWTLDMFLSMVRGIHLKGNIELRPLQIFCHYARTWLSLDMFMVATDWTFIYFTVGRGSDVAGLNKLLRSGKALRAARVLRAVRLIRTVKVFQSIRDFVENLKSEYLALVIKLSGSILAIVIMSHYVTCVWYMQARFSQGEKTWITEFLNTNPRAPFPTEYVTSMHFSLTQLAGSQDIVPQNARERLVASIIIVFDIVVFSSLVGVITDIMAQFRSLTFERSKEVGLIRKFFIRTNMRPGLERRIWAYFRRHYRSQLRYIREGDVPFFQHLPSSLRMDLHEHLYIPAVMRHLLFKRIYKYDRHSLLATCSTSFETESHGADSEIFTEGQQAKYMYFIVVGTLVYTAIEFSVEEVVDTFMWVSEVVLWTRWLHSGRLVSQEDCEFLKINAESFEMTMKERADTSEWFRCLKKYAAIFAQRMSDSFDSRCPITDIDVCMDLSQQDMVDRAFNATCSKGKSLSGLGSQGGNDYLDSPKSS